MLRYRTRKINEKHTINDTYEHKINYHVFEHVEGAQMTSIYLQKSSHIRYLYAKAVIFFLSGDFLDLLPSK